ncbi:MAG: LamG-like jellyroll fold domain-containing protein [Phycisphaerae bacterium]
MKTRMKKLISIVLVLTLGLAAEVAKADFTFGTPIPVPNVNSSAQQFAPSISADGLELYFTSNRPGGYGDYDIWVTTRATTDDPWGTPVNLGPTVNSSAGEGAQSISADGLTLYFSDYGLGVVRPGGSGGYDIWVTTRATKDDEWGTPVNLGPTVNSSADDWSLSISANDLSLYFASKRSGGYGGTDLWVTTRATTDDDWSTPVNLGTPVNSLYNDGAPGISSDGLLLYFSDTLQNPRPGGYGGADLWVTMRATVSDPWGTPVNLGPIVNSSRNETKPIPKISADGLTLYFGSNRPSGYGSWNVWQVSISPVVDLNGDGIVDSADMCIMVDYWGTDEPLCDIGPTPFGDGIVDVQDLIVLAEHLFEELNDPTLVAHWALDETDGDIASDIANDNDGTVYGGPAWQPEGGQVGGALAFDGIDDCLSTPFVLNPADREFSVYVWVKGGAPGQVIISQTNVAGTGRSWLCTDLSEGKLMTELMTLGRGGGIPIVSETVITDGNWHRIGFIWDGSYRYLYVDGAEVAKDTESFSMLESSDGGLYLGTGTAMEPGSFWSGLIDDIRIYNRVVKP